MTTESKIEQTAKDMRALVRKKAGLDPMWTDASVDMRDWYRRMAKRMIDAAGAVH